MKPRDPMNVALRLQRQAARQGFDWKHSAPLWAKLQEEIAELRAVARKPKKAQEELGDLLFMVVNLARHFGLDPKAALKGANRKSCAATATCSRTVKIFRHWVIRDVWHRWKSSGSRPSGGACERC